MAAEKSDVCPGRNGHAMACDSHGVLKCLIPDYDSFDVSKRLFMAATTCFCNDTGKNACTTYFHHGFFAPVFRPKYRAFFVQSRI